MKREDFTMRHIKLDEQTEKVEHEQAADPMRLKGASRSTTESITSCYDLAERVGMIGALKNAPGDLSTNPDHFQGFGKDNSVTILPPVA